MFESGEDWQITNLIRSVFRDPNGCSVNLIAVALASDIERHSEGRSFPRNRCSAVESEQF